MLDEEICLFLSRNLKKKQEWCSSAVKEPLNWLYSRVSTLGVSWRRSSNFMNPTTLSDFADSDSDFTTKFFPDYSYPQSSANGTPKPSVCHYCPIAGQPFHSPNCTLLQWAAGSGAVGQKEQDVLLQPVRACSQQTSILFPILPTVLCNSLLSATERWQTGAKPDVSHLTDSWIDSEQGRRVLCN